MQNPAEEATDECVWSLLVGGAPDLALLVFDMSEGAPASSGWLKPPSQ